MAGEASPPIPDPTVLTTEQLLREIAGLKDWVEAKIDGHADVQEEKFKSVGTQLSMMEKSRIEQKADAADALRAALTSSTAQIAAQAQQISDLKDRVSKVENIKLGAVEQRATQTESRTGLYALVACAVGVLGLLIVVMNMLP